MTAGYDIGGDGGQQCHAPEPLVPGVRYGWRLVVLQAHERVTESVVGAGPSGVRVLPHATIGAHGYRWSECCWCAWEAVNSSRFSLTPEAEQQERSLWDQLRDRP